MPFTVFPSSLWGLYSVITAAAFVLISVFDIDWNGLVERDRSIDWIEASLDFLLPLIVLLCVMISDRGLILPNISVFLVSAFVFYKKTNPLMADTKGFGPGFWKIFSLFFAPVVVFSIVSLFTKV